MKIKELLKIIEAENIPNDAEIVVFADIGGNHEQVESYAVTRSNNSKIDNDYNNAIFEHYPPDEMSGCYEEEDLKDYDYNDKVTAICLYSI
jgi:hypothetical protein